jgi:hypothetical protein
VVQTTPMSRAPHTQAPLGSFCRIDPGGR